MKRNITEKLFSEGHDMKSSNPSVKKALKEMISRPMRLLMLIVADAGFLFSLFFLSIIFEFLGKNMQASLSISVFVASIYTLLFVLLYSIFKNFVLYALHGKRIQLLPFFILNLVMIFIFALLFGLFGFFIVSMKENVAPFIALMLMLLFSATAYLSLQASHYALLNKNTIMGSIRKGFGFCLAFRKHFPLLCVFLVSLVAFVVIFLAIGTALKNTAFQDPLLFVMYNPWYVNSFVILFTVFVYLAALVNRFYLRQIFDR